ncbi:cbb3-type cytochrome oxidase subunit 3 [Thiohalophilus sp.]|uniref:cbb3-type cytochrome oxidase subunit 3 n=1 Tax=Thiohalophilus sp. TaxID=3028392 RepID=UPI003974926A
MSWSGYLYLFGIPLIFIGIIVYIYRPGAKRRYRQDAQIPLKENDNHNRHRNGDKGEQNDPRR